MADPPDIPDEAYRATLGSDLPSDILESAWPHAWAAWLRWAAHQFEAGFDDCDFYAASHLRRLADEATRG